MLPLEVRLRSIGRVVTMFVVGFVAVWALLVSVTHRDTAPQLAPCPPGECAFHAHAPHGPGG